MRESTYFNPRPQGTLGDLFRFWDHQDRFGQERDYFARAKARVRGLIKYRFIEVSPALDPHWQLQAANFTYWIDVPGEDPVSAHRWRYTVLRWNARLFGPEPAGWRKDVTPPPSPLSAPDTTQIEAERDIVTLVETYHREHGCSVRAACEALYKGLHAQSATALRQAFYRNRRQSKDG